MAEGKTFLPLALGFYVIATSSSLSQGEHLHSFKKKDSVWRSRVLLSPCATFVYNAPCILLRLFS